MIILIGAGTWIQEPLQVNVLMQVDIEKKAGLENITFNPIVHSVSDI